MLDRYDWTRQPGVWYEGVQSVAAEPTERMVVAARNQSEQRQGRSAPCTQLGCISPSPGLVELQFHFLRFGKRSCSSHSGGMTGVAVRL